MQAFDNFIQTHPGITYFMVLGMVLGAMLIYYGNFAQTITRWSRKPVKCRDGKIRQPKLKFGEKLKCFIPIYQVCLVHKALYKSAGWTGIMAAVSAAFIIIRAVNAFLLPISSMVMLCTTFLAYAGVILMLLLYGIVTASTARTYGFSGFMTLISFALPPIGAWYLNTAIPQKMRAIHKEDIFSEHKQDTVIKSRSH